MEAESGSEGWERLKFEDALSLALKTEEGAISQGMGEALETGKGQEASSPLEPSGGKQPCPHCDFNQVRPILDFWPRKWLDNKRVLF